MFISEMEDFGATARTTASRRMWARALIMQIRALNVSLRTRGASLNSEDVQKGRTIKMVQIY